MTPSTQDARAAGLMELAERVDRETGISNCLDGEIEIALFNPPADGFSSVRWNAAKTKLIYTKQDGSEVTHWPIDWTMDRPRASRRLRALAARMMDKQMTARGKAVLIERARNMVRSGGPHEWGYRDLADGTFIADPFPFQAAQVLAVMTPEPAQPAESPEARALQKALEFSCMTLAFIGRDQHTDRIDGTLDGLCKLALELEPLCRTAFAATTARPTERGEVEDQSARDRRMYEQGRKDALSGEPEAFI